MAGEQDIIQLPYKIAGLKGDDLILAIDRNLKEIERQLSILQMYMKKIGKPADETINNVTTPTGQLDTSKLSDKMVGLEHELQLADQAVTEAKIAVRAIKTPHLDDGCVTDMKLVTGTITESKLNWQTHLIF